MIYTKNNPVGIDIPIQKLQEKLHTELNLRWGLGADDYQSYGRVYRNQDQQNRFIPEAFKSGKDYLDPMTNDKRTLTSFFGESSRTEIQGLMAETPVHIIFCMDLKKIKPEIVHRGDEEAHIDILSIIDSWRKNVVTSTDIWMDSIFREYNGYKSQEGMLYTDLQPYHCFRVNLTLRYKNLNC